MDDKVTKVTIERGGTVFILEGEEADKWDKIMSSYISYGCLNGMMPNGLSELHWKCKPKGVSIPVPQEVKEIASAVAQGGRVLCGRLVDKIKGNKGEKSDAE